MIANRRVFPLAVVERGIGRGRDFATDAQQRAKGVERVEAPVKSEGELVQIGLQVLTAHAVVAPAQPAFEVAEHEVDDRQVFLGDLGAVALDHGKVLEAPLSQSSVARSAIRDDHAARHNGVVNEACEGPSALVGHDFKAQAAGVAPTPTVLFGVVLLLADLDGTDHKRLIVLAFSLAARDAADPRLVNLDMAGEIAADPVTIRADHAGPELVQDLEGRLVALEAKLALELRRAESGRVAGDQIRGPEPRRERRARPLHDRPGRQRYVAAALAAAQHARPVGEPERLARPLAVRTAKAALPADFLQIGGAGRVIGKELLEARQRLGERQVAVLEDVSDHGLHPARRFVASYDNQLPDDKGYRHRQSHEEQKYNHGSARLHAADSLAFVQRVFKFDAGDLPGLFTIVGHNGPDEVTRVGPDEEHDFHGAVLSEATTGLPLEYRGSICGCQADKHGLL
jgi:hypothetical protein